MKKPSVIKPEAFLFVAQCLNELRHACPTLIKQVPHFFQSSEPIYPTIAYRVPEEINLDAEVLFLEYVTGSVCDLFLSNILYSRECS